jgi:two-component system response regulator ArlR
MKLLLAEDEEMLSDALVEILSHNNYSVDAVYNGQDALDYLSMGDYDGAILDIMMPKMDGVTVVRKLRAQGNTIPVLLLTAKSETDDKVDGLDAGADDYLTKPFDSKELLARVRAITRRQPALTSNTLQVADLSLDRISFTLSSQKGEIRLSNKEFQMLEVLMSNEHQVVPTERFIEKIWGYDADLDVSVIWVYISGLRKKIAKLSKSVVIRAVRGVGYVMEEEE